MVKPREVIRTEGETKSTFSQLTNEEKNVIEPLEPNIHGGLTLIRKADREVPHTPNVEERDGWQMVCRPKVGKKSSAVVFRVFGRR